MSNILMIASRFGFEPCDWEPVSIMRLTDRFSLEASDVRDEPMVRLWDEYAEDYTECWHIGVNGTVSDSDLATAVRLLTALAAKIEGDEQGVEDEDDRREQATVARLRLTDYTPVVRLSSIDKRDPGWVEVTCLDDGPNWCAGASVLLPAHRVLAIVHRPSSNDT